MGTPLRGEAREGDAVRTVHDELLGACVIAGETTIGRGAGIRASDPRTGEPIGPVFHDASTEQVEDAVRAAADAAPELAASDPERRARMLEAVADALETSRPSLVAVADAETALGAARLEGELTRATHQMRYLAQAVREGDAVAPIIDPADPDAAPIPRPDLRRMMVPLGPVGVFGASNFPFAFSVAGGDTASALAAGCPVVVKAHPAHPGTSELSARAIGEAVAAAGMPAGTFSLVHGAAPEVGRALVCADALRAVGFTGSERGGRALFDLAAGRPVPIPVYAEMGSLNPLLITAAAIAARADAIAEGLASAVTLGNGQFCTKPGVILVPEHVADGFVDLLAQRLAATAAVPLLHRGIGSAFDACVDASAATPGVDVRVTVAGEGEAIRGPVLLVTDLDTFLREDALRREHFGPAAIVVRSDPARWLAALAALPGNLTATIHAEPTDAADVADLVRAVAAGVGRVIWNGYPTGVAVTDAQQHGGPYPAATFSAHTSVGATSMGRWLRPVAYQGLPDAALPPELQDANPRGLRRLVAGRWSDAPIDRSDPSGGLA